jgi:hypothetical protein
MRALGRSGSVAEFMQEARQQSRNNWRPEFTAVVVNDWVRQGFGVGEPICRGDLNGDGVVNIQDVTAFMHYHAVGDPRADLNEDGRVDIRDFIELQRALQHGCP